MTTTVDFQALGQKIAALLRLNPGDTAELSLLRDESVRIEKMREGS